MTDSFRVSRSEIEKETAKITERIENMQYEYNFPPIRLLKKGIHQNNESGSKHIAEQLIAALKAFKYTASIDEVFIGPAFTRYDVRFVIGTRLYSVQRLEEDLCMTLGINKINISAAPNKPCVIAFEIPNDSVSTVHLRDIIDSTAFSCSESKLTIAIGKDITGKAVVADLNKLSPLLIAGAPGTGNSSLLHSIIIGLLYKTNPDNLKFILIDTKGVEFGKLNGIPHLYIPVVTDPKKASGALEWAVTEIRKRYRLFSEVNVGNFESYNEYLLENGQPEMSNVVFIIDELSDLMLVASKTVEESICNVAQMGRDAGVYLIIATHRISADVTTGLIKANIPNRIAFAVSSVHESRTILDKAGADNLIGMGDMLYAPENCGSPLHVQGAFVSDEERDQIVEFVKRQSTSQYLDEVMAQIEKAATEKGKSTNSNVDSSDSSYDYDELLLQAVDVIFGTEQASVSMIQRCLKLGYSRAARIVDQMEELGIVGPFEGSKPRQILITKEQWAEMQCECINDEAFLGSVWIHTENSHYGNSDTDEGGMLLNPIEQQLPPDSRLLKTVDALYQDDSVLVFVYSDKIEAEGASVEKVTINYERITKIGVMPPKKFSLKKPTPELHIRYYDEENAELDVYLKTRAAQELADLIVPYLQ